MSGCPASKGHIRLRKWCRKEDMWTVKRLFSSWGKAKLGVQQHPGSSALVKKQQELQHRRSQTTSECPSATKSHPWASVSTPTTGHCPPVLAGQPDWEGSSVLPAQVGLGGGQGAMVSTSASAPHATTSVTGWLRAVTAQLTCQSWGMATTACPPLLPTAAQLSHSVTEGHGRWVARWSLGTRARVRE